MRAANEPATRDANATVRIAKSGACLSRRDITLNIIEMPIGSLQPNPRNARTHSKKQIQKLMRCIQEFGFLKPIVADEKKMILAGHGAWMAAKGLRMKTVPVVQHSHMDETQKREYVLFDNKVALDSGWDNELLALELGELAVVGAVELTGFDAGEVDALLTVHGEDDAAGPEDQIPEQNAHAVTQPGDTWMLGPHRLGCANSSSPNVWHPLLDGEQATAMVTDPPYNVPIDKHVCITGAHREFAMAAGEMSEEQFASFLEQTLGPAAQHLKHGALSAGFMDWRHAETLLAVGRTLFSDLNNICVWTKGNGGMGSLCRSQHEFVFIFKSGTGPHINNVQLGRYGRNRTNVWAYPGLSAFGAGRDATLAMHPTVKPVVMLEDFIKDVTHRNDLMLDPFGGSGSTLIAAHRCRRRARLIEIDPIYCDVIVRRFQEFTGKCAVNQHGGELDERADSLEAAQ